MVGRMVVTSRIAVTNVWQQNVWLQREELYAQELAQMYRGVYIREEIAVGEIPGLLQGTN
jgi:hypothetical protein